MDAISTPANLVRGVERGLGCHSYGFAFERNRKLYSFSPGGEGRDEGEILETTPHPCPLPGGGEGVQFAVFFQTQRQKGKY